MKKVIVEGLDYQDLVNQIIPIVSIDEYSAKSGADDETVTIAFIVKSKQAGNDLVDWLEKGYDWVIDAQISDGELSPNRYLVFAETNRRTRTPERVIEMLDDLETLCGYALKDWTVKVGDEDYSANLEVLKKAIIMSPHLYRQEKETGLNEMRALAGVAHSTVFTEQDAEIKALKAIAGL